MSANLLGLFRGLVVGEIGLFPQQLLQDPRGVGPHHAETKPVLSQFFTNVGIERLDLVDPAPEGSSHETVAPGTFNQHHIEADGVEGRFDAGEFLGRVGPHIPIDIHHLATRAAQRETGQDQPLQAAHGAERLLRVHGDDRREGWPDTSTAAGRGRTPLDEVLDECLNNARESTVRNSNRLNPWGLL